MFKKLSLCLVGIFFMFGFKSNGTWVRLHSPPVDLLHDGIRESPDKPENHDYENYKIKDKETRT